MRLVLIALVGCAVGITAAYGTMKVYEHGREPQIKTHPLSIFSGRITALDPQRRTVTIAATRPGFEAIPMQFTYSADTQWVTTTYHYTDSMVRGITNYMGTPRALSKGKMIWVVRDKTTPQELRILVANVAR